MESCDRGLVFHPDFFPLICNLAIFQVQMGNPSVEVTEEMQDAAQIEKSKALDAISEGMPPFCCDCHFSLDFLGCLCDIS